MAITQAYSNEISDIYGKTPVNTAKDRNRGNKNTKVATLDE